MSYSTTSTSDGCYTGTTVLINKLGLKEQDALDYAEKIVVSAHSVEIESADNTEQIDFEYYCSIHRRLFEDIYDWAGQVRTVDLSKKGTHFCEAVSICRVGNAIFNRLKDENFFCGTDWPAYISEIADLYNSLNMLHPFREGNGRTQRLFFTLLIRKAGYDIDFSSVDTDELMFATIYAAQGVMDYLIDFFNKAIQKK